MPPEAGRAPLVLGFDTSGGWVAAALLAGEAVLAADEVAMATGQSERLLPVIEGLLAAAGRRWPALAAIGVGTGPGNFTGLRIAVAAARGLALGLGVPAVGVGRLEALAEGQPRPLLVAAAAGRGQTAVALATAGGVEPAVLAAAGDLPDRWRGSGLAVAGDGAEGLAAGSGGPWLAPARPLAVAIAAIAARRRAAPGPRPAPLYLRAADAAPMAAPPHARP